jgi:type VI secretion system protein ImpF
MKENVTPSLIDRLIDLEPRQAADSPQSRNKSVQDFKASVRRDLQWLLNTRRIHEQAPESMAETYRSLYNFGLPDYSSLSVNSVRDYNTLLGEIEDTIKLFEPRLKNFKVRLVPDYEGNTRKLHFQIEGMLDMDPAPEAVSFDTIFEIASGEYEVKGGA